MANASTFTVSAARVVLDAHIRGPSGMCAGCRAWWGRLVPYPCAQAEWALLVAGHEMTERFLATPGVRDGQPADGAADR